MKWVLSGRLEVTEAMTSDVTQARPTSTIAPSAASGARFTVQVGTQSLAVEVLDRNWPMVVLVNGKAIEVARQGERGFSADGRARTATRAANAAARERSGAGSGSVVAPMPGRVLRLLCAVGDHVARGQALVVLEAMKMENEQVANAAGVVREVLVREGESVDAGAKLIRIEPPPPVDVSETPR
jgi:biotin carboxyl carrier protein